jgi:hypothetical protein
MATVLVNRAPVLTLWAAVVAERLGFSWHEAVTLGRAVAGLNAYSKGVSLGLFEPTPEAEHERRRKARHGETLHVDLLHRAVPAVQTPEGLRALSKDRPISPESVERYLEGKFGDAYPAVRHAMSGLARSRSPSELAATAYELYEKFRPAIPPGVRGWGAAGKLNLTVIDALTTRALYQSSD